MKMYILAVFATVILAANADSPEKFRNATIEEFPYQVFLETYDENTGNYTYVCGGSIISPELVLTAGHCVKSTDLYQVKIRAGTSTMSKGGSEHTIVHAILHEDFQAQGKLMNDIVLLRVAPPFLIDKTRRPIALYRRGEEAVPGARATVSGWGYNITSGEIPSQLRAVNVSLVDSKSCHDAVEVESGTLVGQICAALTIDVNVDVCHVNSGNPLAVNGKLAGIVSWGYRCWRPNRPTVYTEVAYYRDWIKKNSGI